MSSEEYTDKVKKLSEDFVADEEEQDMTLAESNTVYALKKYVDKRFDLLKEYLHQ